MKRDLLRSMGTHNQEFPASLCALPREPSELVVATSMIKPANGEVHSRAELL